MFSIFNSNLEKKQKQGMFNIIYTQCVGLPAVLLFQNGIIFNYLEKLDFSNELIVLFKNVLPSFILILITLPAAFYSDRLGKKRVGNWGLIIAISAFAFIMSASMLPVNLKVVMITTGFMAHSLGQGLMGSSWFALLSPIIPAEVRGRFFAILRIAWQISGIATGLFFAYLLKRHSGIEIYQTIFGIVIVMSALRLIFYNRIPDLEHAPDGKSFLVTLKKVITKTPGFIPFCSYLCLLTFSISACPTLFQFIQKDVLNFSSSQIVLLKTLLFSGAVIGYVVGGYMVDHINRSYVFIAAHCSYVVVILFFIIRDILPFSPFINVSMIFIIFGLIQAAASIAITSELLSLLPSVNKSLATALNSTMIIIAMTLSNFLVSKIIPDAETITYWKLFSLNLTSFDTILCGFIVLTTLSLIALPLVPSVRKSLRKV